MRASRAAFEGPLPDTYTDVRFKLPVLPPATVGFAASTVDEGRRFELFDAGTGKPHLAGTIAPGHAITGGAG